MDGANDGVACADRLVRTRAGWHGGAILVGGAKIPLGQDGEVREGAWTSRCVTVESLFGRGVGEIESGLSDCEV